MAERESVLQFEKIAYSGAFNFQELFDLIARFFREMGYDDVETQNYQQNYPSGKHIFVQMYPYKKITDYVKFVIKVEVLAKNLKDIEVKSGRKKERTNHGDLEVNIDAFIIYDYFNKWEGRPYFVFLRSLFDRVLYREENEKFRQGIITEVSKLKATIKKYLNTAQARHTHNIPSGRVGLGMGEHMSYTRPRVS